MPPRTDLGLLGCGIVGVATALAALRVERFAAPRRVAVALFAALVLLMPAGELPLAAYVRGATGDLSITTLLLAASACSARLTGRAFIASHDRRALLWGLVVVAALFYPFALGLTSFDPYAHGFGSAPGVTLLLLITLAAWYAGRPILVTVILAAALAYLGRAYDSRNPWDYLIDPLACGFALIELIRR